MDTHERLRTTQIPGAAFMQEKAAAVQQDLSALKTEITIGIAYPQVERVTQKIKPEIPTGFDKAYRAAKKRGDIIVALSNHQGHTDAFTAALAINTLRAISNPEDPLSQKFAIIIASTIESGKQGRMIQRGFEVTRDNLFAPNNIGTIPYTRKKDMEKYEIPSNIREYTAALNAAIAEGTDLFVFPEASVQGGRTNPKTGKIYGIQPFLEETVVTSLINRARRHGRGITLVPIGSHGPFHLLNPDTNQPGKEGWLAVAGLGKPDLIQVRFGMPFTGEDLKRKIPNLEPSAVNDFVIYQFMQLTPQEAHGAYAMREHEFQSRFGKPNEVVVFEKV